MAGKGECLSFKTTYIFHQTQTAWVLNYSGSSLVEGGVSKQEESEKIAQCSMHTLP